MFRVQEEKYNASYHLASLMANYIGQNTGLATYPDLLCPFYPF